MNLAILPGNAPAVTMTSREIAELTGKDHKNVCRDILSMFLDIQEDALSFERIYFDSMNRAQTEFELDRELTDLLLTGYSTILRRKVLARWRELEAKQAAPAIDTDEEKLLLIQQMATKQLALIHENKQIAIERDHAIKTKAQIGDKKTATAMATASHLKRENNKLKDELGFSTRHATILQVEDAMQGDFNFLPLRNWCKANEVTPEVVPDKRYPKGVKAWPAGAWLAVYGVRLDRLFGEVQA